MKELTIKDGKLSVDAANALDALVDDIKAKEKELKEFRAMLKEAMEEFGIDSISTENHTYKYVSETISEKFDTKKFRLEEPDLYEEYLKASKVSAYVRVL